MRHVNWLSSVNLLLFRLLRLERAWHVRYARLMCHVWPLASPSGPGAARPHSGTQPGNTGSTDTHRTAPS